MPEPFWVASEDNTSRANAGADMLAHTDTNDDETRLADALSELRHWAAREGVDFANALMRALNYFATERTGEN